MKTKTLLIAAAALTAGVISSEAQVYSQNVVGYANVVIKGGGAYTLVANPFDDGNGNQLTNLLAGLPNKSQVVTWNGSSYDGAINKGGGVWGATVPLPPGVGFFVKNGISTSPDYTNTFVGTIVAPVGSSVTNVLPAAFSLVGSQLPYAGDATVDTNINLGTTLANKSQLISWNTSAQVFDGAVNKGGGIWGAPFNVSVGQGFFVNNKAGTNWSQTLNP